MNTARDEVFSLLEALPADATIEDVQYHLYVLEKLKRSEERSRAEGSISHQKVEEQLALWLSN